MPLFVPDTSPPPTLYYAAAQARPLSSLTEETLAHMVADMSIHQSDKEHYITGWMGNSSVVIVNNYQDKRGTSSGFVLTRRDQYRLSVQSITFRIPKFILWLTFRRRPRTMMLITYNTLGKVLSPLVQYRNLLDKPLQQKLEQDWQQLNDYIGMACHQLEHGTPLWRQLADKLTTEDLHLCINSALFAGKRLHQDGEYQGFWSGNVFISRRLSAEPALQLLWRDQDNVPQCGYQYQLITDESGQLRPSVRIRPDDQETRYLLNPFDAWHLQTAWALLNYAAGILAGISPPLMEMMDRPDSLSHL